MTDDGYRQGQGEHGGSPLPGRGNVASGYWLLMV
jgi:hypothetical protein